MNMSEISGRFRGEANQIVIALTIGDPAGIGPEILLKVLSGTWEFPPVKLITFAPRKVLFECATRTIPILQVGTDTIIGGCLECDIINIGDGSLTWTPGRPSKEGALIAWESLDRAIDSVLHHETDALVTGPIHKAEMLKIGFPCPGHTDYLAQKSGVQNPVMLYDSPKTKVGLVTTHIPFREICKQLSVQKIVQTAIRVNDYLLNFVPNPRIAIAGLNPHAGSGDQFGDEEARFILPAIIELTALGMKISGPYPPDTVFHDAQNGEFDAVISLYHDQGSIAVKTLDFTDTVNVTLGLPFIRTSVDHGTAFSIAGTSQASGNNLKMAINLAGRLARQVRTKNERSNSNNQKRSSDASSYSQSS